METIKDHSYGVVPVIKRNGVWEVLLVHQISYRGNNDRFWTFPKGHPEENESVTDTAKRELLEETGISDVHIIADATFTIEYSFMFEGKKIEKTVAYFLGICENKNTAISIPAEIAALEWCTFKEATAKLTHKNAQNVLLQAGEYINKHTQLV